MAKLINILLRKTDPDFPWGFTLGAVPPALHSVQITSVDDGSLASEHLEPGDRVLEIEGIDTTMLSNSEVETLLTNPSNKLELLIMKRAKPGHKLFSEPNVGTTRTFKTKETVSSTSEEKEETKILNKNLIEESKTVTTEGEIHKQVTETSESTENQRTDTFWTCAPSDLVRTDKRKSAEADHRGTSSRNLSHSNYISESSIFKNLNNYRDEERKLDPREEKRRFWESCRKGDHVRRFKWGDSVKPNGVSPTGRSDGSTESLYCKSPSNPVSIPKMERSKSCEPSDCQSTFNPFFQFKNNTCVSPTNPFYREFERANNSQTNEIFSSSLDEKKLKSLQKPVAQKLDESLFTRESIQNNLSSSCFYDNQSTKCYKDIAEHIQSENHRTVEHFAHEVKKAEGKTSSDDVNMCSGNWSPQADSTNVVSKNEFETKRKFFENVCSVPTASVNTSAREIVEEKLLDRGTSAPTTPTPLWTEPKNTYQKESNLEAHSYHTLKKPSDFINQKMGTGDALHNQIKPEISEKMKLVEEVENAPYQNTMSTEEQISSQESTKFYVGHVSEDTTNYSKNQFATEENQADFNRFQAIQDQKVLNSKNSSWGASDWNAESSVGSTSDEQSKETLKSKNHTTDSFASEECMSHHSYVNDSFEAGWTSPYKTYALNEQMSTRRGGSLERDFYERKVFKESNYKRVSKGSQSPYENVVSASSKEYQEECRPCTDSEKRSRTPAEFYDNYEVPIKLVRAKSPIDISFKTFRDIQTRLGTLLGAKPISIENFKYHSERAGKDSVEEAFQKLAIQEGIVDSTNCDESISWII